MIFTKKMHEIKEPSVLKSNERSAHFLYPVQPQQVSAIEPILKSIEDVMQNSDISMQIQNQKIFFVEKYVENPCTEQDETQKLTSLLKDFPFLEDGYSHSKRPQTFKILSIFQSEMMQITTNFGILIILIILPVQLAFNQNSLTVLYLLLFLMQGIQFFNIQFEVIDWKQLLYLYPKNQITNNIIMIFACLVMQLDYLPFLQWVAYFLTFMCNKSTFTSVLCQIKRYIICILPENQIYCQYLDIISKVILIIHILNCYIYQSLQQKLMLHSYFDTLVNITINIVTLNNNLQQENQSIQAALLLSYLFMLLIILGSDQKYYQISNDISNYFQNNIVPLSIKFQIYDEVMNKSKESTKFFEQLPIQIQEKISYTQKISFIQDNFKDYEEPTKFTLTQICTVQHYRNGQCIIELNQKDDNSLYYLNQGCASIKLPKKVKITIKNKSTFGQLSFFTQCPRTATIFCDTNCTVYKLQRKQFLDCLTNHDKELFQLTKDSIQFENTLPINCLCCQNDSHILANCPQISYQKIVEHRQQIYMKNNQTQSRAYYLRTNSKNIKTIFKNNDQQDDISILKYMGYPSQDSNKLLSEKVLPEKYSTIQEQLLSSSKICSLQDTYKLIPSAILELSHDSMSIKSAEDDNGSYKITRKNRRKQQTPKFQQQITQVQKQYESDSLLESSSSFKGEYSNSSNQQLPHWGTLIKSQGSYPQKTDSAAQQGFSSFQIFSSGNDNHLISNNIAKVDIDKMHIFQHYYPNNNYDQIFKESK